jgi:hypothetical protein
MMSQLPEVPPDSGRHPGTVNALLYNRSTDTLVAVMANGFEPGPPVHRLYTRRLPGVKYRPIGVRHEWESQQDAHSCERTPFLIYNEFRFREREPRTVPAYLGPMLKMYDLPPEGWGADWLGIRVYNLETGEDVRVLDGGQLNPPPPYTSGWVSDILSVSADGSGAVCKVGLMPGGGVDYFVFEVSLKYGLMRMIAKLPEVFL